MFNFLGKELINQIYFCQNLIANQVVGMLGVFNSGSLFPRLECKIIRLNL